MVKIKFCGITQRKDAEIAVKLGADAVGLVFCPTSKRTVSPDKAAAIIERLPPFITVVGVFVNPTEAEVREVLSYVPLNCLQFHGDETAEFCRLFKMPFIKVFRVGQTDIRLEDLHQQYPEANAILLDTYEVAQRGGTGKTFDWQRVTPYASRAWILSGGLTPANVATAVQQLKPYAVDVSSGIEQAPGIKDEAKMRAFIEALRGVPAEA